MKRTFMFKEDDPWFIRITQDGVLPIKLHRIVKKRVIELEPHDSEFIVNFYNGEFNKTVNINRVTKKTFSVILEILLEAYGKEIYNGINGKWYEKLISDVGLHEDDMDFAVVTVLSEALYFSMMLPLLEHDFNRMSRLGHTYSKGRFVPSGADSFYSVSYYDHMYNTKLVLKGEVISGEIRGVNLTEIGQLYTIIYSYHLKSMISAIASLNDFTFAELPKLDTMALTRSSGLISQAATVITSDLEIINENTREIHTLLSSANLSTNEIDIKIENLATAINGNNKTVGIIKDQINRNNLNGDGREGSIIDFLLANSESSFKACAMQSKFLWDGIKDVVGYVKNHRLKNGVKQPCSMCIPVKADVYTNLTGGAFVIGLVVGIFKKNKDKFVDYMSQKEVIVNADGNFNLDTYHNNTSSSSTTT